MIWLLLMPAYLLGTFPNASIVARSRGINIEQVGSGNPGASNIARVMGTKWGVVVFILDGLKGAIPAATGLLLDNRAAAYGMLAAAVLGHMFPITRRFRGGKGVATMGGGALVLQPVVSLALFAVWGIVRKVSGKASIASLTIMAGLPVGVAVWTTAPGWEVAAIVGCNTLVLMRHVDNIKRLLAGRELSASRSS